MFVVVSLSHLNEPTINCVMAKVIAPRNRTGAINKRHVSGTVVYGNVEALDRLIDLPQLVNTCFLEK